VVFPAPSRPIMAILASLVPKRLEMADAKFPMVVRRCAEGCILLGIEWKKTIVGCKLHNF
jgi:hypothetical protein